jgi:hypothetical protein
MSELTPQQQQGLVKAREFYRGHDGAVGVFQAEGIPEALLKSGVEGGPWGGAQRGGVPRGPGWGFTQGGPSQGNVSTHVEGHAAAIMWQRKLTSGTLFVDRAMCGICSRDLSDALPPGSTLTIISEAEGRTIVRSSHAASETVPPLESTSLAGNEPNFLPAGTREIELGRVTAGRGTANAGAMLIAFAVVDTLCNYLTARITDAKVKNEILQIKSQITAYQREHPSEGALVALTYSRKVPNDPTGVVRNSVLIHPGDVFQYSSVYFSTTPEKAMEQLLRPEVRPDLGYDSPYKLEWSVKKYWINPLKPALQSPAGKWRVHVAQYLWIYDFDSHGSVRWTDPFNQETGTGTWKVQDDSMIIRWDAPSTGIDTWEFPLVPNEALGRCVLSNKSNFRLQAELIP